MNKEVDKQSKYPALLFFFLPKFVKIFPDLPNFSRVTFYKLLKLWSWSIANLVVVLDTLAFTLDIVRRMWYQFSAMYIRKVRKTDKRTGKSYFYHQLIEAYRTPKGSRQRILLNLGKLDIDDRERKMLTDRIEQLITGQLPFMPPANGHQTNRYHSISSLTL